MADNGVDGTLIAVAVAIAFALLLTVLVIALAIQRYCGADVDLDNPHQHQPRAGPAPEHSWVAEARALRERKARAELMEHERLLIADFPIPAGGGGYGLSRSASSGAGNGGRPAAAGEGGYGLSHPSAGGAGKVKPGVPIAMAEHKFAVRGANDGYRNVGGGIMAAAPGSREGHERAGNSVRSAVNAINDAQRAGGDSTRTTAGPPGSQLHVPGGHQGAYAAANALEVEYTSVKDTAEALFQMSVPQTVVLRNGSEGFGLMCSESKTPRGGVFYCSARPGSVAANTPTLVMGSRILEVNHTSVITASLDDLATVLRMASSAASLRLKILLPMAAQLLARGPASRYQTHGTVTDHRSADSAATARALVSPPPPPPPTTTTWKPVQDSKGRTYYWNTTTNAVSWVNPEAERRDGGVTDGNRGGSHDALARQTMHEADLARQTMHEADLVDFKAEFVASWSQDKTAGDGDDVSLGLISP